jgi:PilZ domain
MSEKERGTPDSSALEMDTLPQGRYIPYSGGSMGWFENQGVLRCERGNNYRYRQVMDSEYVRSALFQRWGQVTDKRGAERIARENSVNVLMSDESVAETAFQLTTAGGTLSGVTKDISHYGMRVQFREPVKLAKGDPVTVQLLASAGGQVALELPASVAWIKREVVVRPVWFVGVAFLELTAETERFFSEFLHH